MVCRGERWGGVLNIWGVRILFSKYHYQTGLVQNTFQMLKTKKKSLEGETVNILFISHSIKDLFSAKP
jgi:hypothetical protein